MDLERIAAIAQIVAYVLGVLTVFMGFAALIWMVGKGARRRSLLLLVLDVVALTMILGPVILGWLHAGSLTEWAAIFQIAGLALELTRVGLAYAELRVVWPGLAERAGGVPRGLFRLMRWSKRSGLSGFLLLVGVAAVQLFLLPPYESFEFDIGSRPEASGGCVTVASPGSAGASAVCQPSYTWTLGRAGAIDARAGEPSRNALSVKSEMTYDVRVSGTCRASVRWSAYVNGARAGGGVLHGPQTVGLTTRMSEIKRQFFDVPTERPVRELRLTAERLDRAPCPIELVVRAPAMP